MNMIKLLERLRMKNIKLNERKVRFKTTQVTYLGHLITNQGLRADPEKVEAIEKMPAPQDVK